MKDKMCGAYGGRGEVVATTGNTNKTEIVRQVLLAVSCVVEIVLSIKYHSKS